MTDLATEQQQFDHIIVAAGAWSSQLAPQVPIRPIKGQALLVQAPSGAVLPGCMVRQREVYLIPEPNGQVKVGSTTEDVGFETTPTAAAKAALWEKACALLPVLREGQVLHHWAGLRPQRVGARADGTLVHPVAPGVTVAAGHHKIGLCLAPAVADAVVAAVA